MYNVPASFKIGIVPGFRLRLRSLDRFRRFDVAQTAGRNSSMPNPQQVFPLAIASLEATAPAATACDTTWQYEAARNSHEDRLPLALWTTTKSSPTPRTSKSGAHPILLIRQKNGR